MKNADTAAEEKQKLKVAKVNVQLGIAYLERNNVNRAKKKLLLALDQAPNIPETWYSMAYFYESTGNKEQAKKYYLKALSMAPDRGDVQNNYGTYLCRTGEYEQSIDHFMLAVKDPDYLDTSDAYENAGLCALKIPNKKMAYGYFNTAITQNPSRPVSLFKMAQLDYEMGDYQKAKIKLDQYLAIAPSTAQSTSLMTNIKRHLTSNDHYAERNFDTATDVEADDVVSSEPAAPKRKKRVTYKHYLHSAELERVTNGDAEVYYQEKIKAEPSHHKKIHAANKQIKSMHASQPMKRLADKKQKTISKPVHIAKLKMKKVRTPILSSPKVTQNQPLIIAKPKKTEKAYMWSV